MGPIIGGLIVSYFSWRYVFFCKCTDHCGGNHPYTKKFVPESKVEDGEKNDFVGQALMILFFYLVLSIPLSDYLEKGFFAPDILSTGIIGCLAIVIFLYL